VRTEQEIVEAKAFAASMEAILTRQWDEDGEPPIYWEYGGDALHGWYVWCLRMSIYYYPDGGKCRIWVVPDEAPEQCPSHEAARRLATLRNRVAATS